MDGNSEERQKVETIYCSNCGGKNDLENYYCIYCGKQIKKQNINELSDSINNSNRNVSNNVTYNNEHNNMHNVMNNANNTNNSNSKKAKEKMPLSVTILVVLSIALCFVVPYLFVVVLFIAFLSLLSKKTRPYGKAVLSGFTAIASGVGILLIILFGLCILAAVGL